MVVQHNLTAMNSNRMLGVNTATQAKSTEKLSSGYKINRAADDAAGLSISEKMRKQIRGLTQASANAQDGISAVQTAEGALNEVQDMLQRMNELAVKAANGTNSEDDRSYIQNEVDQLITEIDRVAETTKFNETYLLKGDENGVKDYTYSYKAKADANAAITLKAADTETTTISFTAATGTSKASDDSVNAFINDLQKNGINFETVNDSSNVVTLTGSKLTLSATAAAKGYNVVGTGTDGAFKIVDKDDKDVMQLTLTAGSSAETGKFVVDTDQTITAQSTTAEGAQSFYDKNGNKISANSLDSYFTTNEDGTTSRLITTKDLYDAVGNKITATNAVAAVAATQEPTGQLSLSLHVGADSTENNQISVMIKSMSASSLGVNNLKVDGPDDKNALAAIDTISEAIQKISTQRSALGAVQNRLEHTISNLDNVVENTTAAESQIRDTDMATEMVKYSNNNILSQAGQAMLAQANQANQGVLSLLG